MTSLFMPALRYANATTVRDHISSQYGDKTDSYIAAVKKAYPNDTKATDLIDVDDMFRRSALKMADLRVAASSAPVYMYLFTWQSPVMDGVYKSLHCMEIPFVFNNIARCEEMTGGGKDAYVLAEKVSKAWVNFARNGNPNHARLPAWQKYTTQKGATMIFDNQCVEKYHHDKEFLAITPDRTL
jgi:para-nitrobenzyl esterase